MSAKSQSALVRERIGHPVIDSDGHTTDFDPLYIDYLRAAGGTRILERVRSGFEGTFVDPRWYRMSAEERRQTRCVRPPWWALPTKNTLDLATSMLPELLHQRLPEMGMDFTVLYPGAVIFAGDFMDDEVRRASCRAVNNFHADVFRGYGERMMPVAVIPMNSPEEALDELHHAVTELGYKAITMPSYVRRPIPAASRNNPTAARYACWLDTYTIDSEYDYDPVWAKCVELKVAPTFHTVSMGVGTRTSISNYMYNHIGHFAAAGEALCKSLFFGGVTRRFPTLRFAFLEGGVGWASSLYNDLIGHWRKRNGTAIANYDPANLDRELFVSLCQQYGQKLFDGKKLEDVVAGSSILPRGASGTREDPAALDDWARCGISDAADIRTLFVPNFFFGCEADDPNNASAFDTRRNLFGARLNAIFSSDIGHWDVPDMREVCEEAYELVEHQVITEEDFRDFVFTNPVKLWCGMNPDFFKGTAVESDVSRLMGS